MTADRQNGAGSTPGAANRQRKLLLLLLFALVAALFYYREAVYEVSFDPDRLRMARLTLEQRKAAVYGRERVRFSRLWDRALPAGYMPLVVDRHHSRKYVASHLVSSLRVTPTDRVLVVYGDPPGVSLDLPPELAKIYPRIDLVDWLPVLVSENGYLAVRKDLAEQAGIGPESGPTALTKLLGYLP